MHAFEDAVGYIARQCTGMAADKVETSDPPNSCALAIVMVLRVLEGPY